MVVPAVVVIVERQVAGLIDPALEVGVVVTELEHGLAIGHSADNRCFLTDGIIRGINACAAIESPSKACDGLKSGFSGMLLHPDKTSAPSTNTGGVLFIIPASCANPFLTPDTRP